MKKVFIIILAFVLLLSGCVKRSTGNAETHKEIDHTSQDNIIVDESKKGKTYTATSYALWNLSDYMDNMPYIFEGTILSSKEYPASDNDKLLEIQIETVYQGDLTEGDRIQFRTSVWPLFPVGERRLIFAEVGASVFQGIHYLFSDAALYPINDHVNQGIVQDLKGMTYEDVLEEIIEYTKDHPFKKETHVLGDYCDSDDLSEIYEYSNTVLEVIPQAVDYNEIEDRTTYSCKVIETIKGTPFEAVIVTAQKESLELGKEYVMLLTRPEGSNGNNLVISAQRSVFLADSEEAELIRSFR